MARRGGWRRVGSRRRFRYEDSRGKWITDPDKIERIEALVIPPAWRDVWISPRANAKLQATGVDKAGRGQYLYHPEFRARQEQAKYDKLVRFADHLPDLRQAMSDDLEGEEFTREWTCALAVKLINLGWFRVGAERYAKQYRTFGITTLNKSHVAVRGKRVAFRYRGKHRVWVRTVIVDAELAEAMRSLVSLDGGRRLFRYRLDDGFVNLDSRKLNEYIQERMGEEFTAKDFRTWGGTLIAAVALAGVMSRIRRPKPSALWLRLGGARSRIAAALVAHSAGSRSRIQFAFGVVLGCTNLERKRRALSWLEKPCSSATIAARKSVKARARPFVSRIPTPAAAQSRQISATTARPRCRARPRPDEAGARSRQPRSVNSRFTGTGLILSP